MKNQQTKVALAIALLVVAAGAFWLLVIGPKREKADELSAEVTAAKAEVASARIKVAAGLKAKRNFPHNYQQLLLLGKAVPADSGTASLMVQIDHLSEHSRTPFLGIELKEGAGAEEGTAEGEAPTALAALGSGVGPAGLRAMPYELTFKGGYFDAADFIQEMNSLVTTEKGRVHVNGRLMTFDRFELAAGESSLNPKHLTVKFFASAYTTPPGQGLTAGATATGPAPE
jgi:Tfp pilus assembly protein PilO